MQGAKVSAGRAVEVDEEDFGEAFLEGLTGAWSGLARVVVVVRRVRRKRESVDGVERRMMGLLDGVVEIWGLERLRSAR